ncbi:site-specific integrase [Rhodomicrobium vannielii ATCC 17100]|uniref:tyrosine-type recombinase/integrase n=1 Tax=Rhodomicrobium vannielii TaxID=1069 RepID=UPI0019180771|nr:site-specific integrase [Rhodomicrobium vannielii]MBJ7533318.1 site-specific integrase [Rhodomicrobium vannielii ATCC 17100]
MKLTALAVARLSPPSNGQVDYFDSTLPAFGVRVSTAGTRTYFVMTRVHGKLARLTIGKAKIEEDAPGLALKDARAKAGELVDLASRGIDPRQEKAAERAANQDRSRRTFRSVGERFMEQYVEQRLATSTQREYSRTLFGKDTAIWAHRPVASITRADVRALLDRIVERGSPGAANHMLAYLSKFFNWCAEKDLIEVPPTDRIKAPAPKNVGERVLNESEIVEVWRAFEGESLLFRALFKLLLLTGQRRGEVCGMQRSELTLNGGRPFWEIPGKRTKNKRPHVVPLAPSTVAIIAGLPRIGDGDFLFTTTGVTAMSGFGKAKQRIDARIAEARTDAGLQPMPEWDMHDLRRTMVTMMNERLGIVPHVVEACVNHISGRAKAGVAGVYNKALYLHERREALTAWANLVQSLVQDEASLAANDAHAVA